MRIHAEKNVFIVKVLRVLMSGYVRWVREEDDEETFTLKSDESSSRLSRSHSELSFFTAVQCQWDRFQTFTHVRLRPDTREKQWSLPHYMGMMEIMQEAEKSLISCSNKQFAGLQELCGGGNEKENRVGGGKSRRRGSSKKKCHYAKYWEEPRDFRFSFCCHPHRLLNIKEFMKLFSIVGSLQRAFETAGILSQASSRGGFISASFISMFKAVNKQKAHKSYQFAFGVCITFSSTIYSILDFFMLRTGNKKKWEANINSISIHLNISVVRVSRCLVLSLFYVF